MSLAINRDLSLETSLNQTSLDLFNILNREVYRKILKKREYASEVKANPGTLRYVDVSLSRNYSIRLENSVMPISLSLRSGTTQRFHSYGDTSRFDISLRDQTEMFFVLMDKDYGLKTETAYFKGPRLRIPVDFYTEVHEKMISLGFNFRGFADVDKWLNGAIEKMLVYEPD